MAKQFIIAAMEEVMGEYILNMSKDNLKIAALRGHIKLENVQLDGDLIGSHVLGSIGLTSFGVLSCSAKSLKASVPWSNLEKEPTRFEVKGVHLVCVPLTPSTANQMYGSGSAIDPRCTLRTRAKRLVLARFERNFWNGQIPNEGPVMKRIQRAVKEVERDMKRNGSKKQQRGSGGAQESDSATSPEDAEMDVILNNLVYGVGGGGDSSVSDRHSEHGGGSSQFSNDDLPELPRDWKVRIREKVLRNIEATLEDVHIRCEVPERGLEVSGLGSPHKSPSRRRGTYAGERAFALGFTLESLVVRTANENWEVGSHEKRRKRADGSGVPSSANDHLGPNEYVVHNNKIGYFNKLSIYWDDDPPILLSETDVLQGNYRKLSVDKLLSRVDAAMEAMFSSQEPGTAIRQSLSVNTPDDIDTDRQHEFICEIDGEIRVRQSDRMLPGPISCSADVLPFNFTFNIRPNQYLQYQRLKAAIQSQHRFDTMLRQRPAQSPKENPRVWWKYAMACVTARPNSRPWEDVKRIGRSRGRYVALVAKKNAKQTDGIGFHAGLSSKESTELLSMEDSLPIEALLAFHLVALRRVFSQNRSDSRNTASADVLSSTKSKSKSSGRFRILRTGANSIKKKTLETHFQQHAESLPQPRDSQSTAYDGSSAGAGISLLDAMTMRLGKKAWFVDWKLRDATINAVLKYGRDDKQMLHLILRASGNARSFGRGKQDFAFAVNQCDVLHGIEKVFFFGNENDGFAESDGEFSYFEGLTAVEKVSFALKPNLSSMAGPDISTPSSFLDLPPHGTVFRLAAGKDRDVFKLSLSAHPATLVWTTSLLDGLSEFFSDRSTGGQIDLTQHIRNAATPLAQKAQLAILSPASLSLHLNVASPKLCVPLVSDNSEGTLLLDAGSVRMASLKDEGETEVQWNVHARDLGVKFVRGANLARFAYGGFTNATRTETSVVRPFSIDASSRILQAGAPGASVSFDCPFRSVEVTVSPICLNLVDAEMLARSFGKWYARGLHRVQHRVLASEVSKNDGKPALESDRGLQQPLSDIKQSGLPKILSLEMEKVEMALEGHSKRLAGSDERSMLSMDSLQEYAPPTRAYLVEVFQISLMKSCIDSTENTKLTVLDSSIVRLRDVAHYTPLKVRHDTIESENCILLRSTSDRANEVDGASSTKDTAASSRRGEGSKHLSGIFQASLLHNREEHVDEVEVDIDSVVLRVTPTTLKDCAKAFRRIMELAQLVTKEMERQVHEQGRRARRRVRDVEGSVIGSVAPSLLGRPASPALSEAMTAFTEYTAIERKSPTSSFDSSILFKVTLNQSTLLAGRPTSMAQNVTSRKRGTSFAVIQVLSNALIMFQSIENPDATGTKTLHVSVDNVSALVNTEFERVSLTESPPMIEPTGAEIRVVYSTENYGCVVSQDVSLDCDSVKAGLTPNDLSILINITRTMFERLRAFGTQPVPGTSSSGKRNALSSLIRYQKKGTGIATRIRAEIQTFSFVLLRAYKSHFGAPEFVDFNVRHVKGLFEGCMSALSGECSALISINFFNSEVSDWEYAVEPFPFTLEVEQMPNELVLNIVPTCPVHLNLTGILLRDLAKMKFDIYADRPGGNSSDIAVLTPSVLSTVGLRRATEARSVTVVNLTGFSIHVAPDMDVFDPEVGLVPSGTTTRLDSVFGDIIDDEVSLSLRLAASTVPKVGEREPVLALPITSAPSQARLFLVKPAAAQLQPGQAEILRLLEGRGSPESMFSEGFVFDTVYYNAEPVVEWCMQNQRLRPSVSDVFSLPKGRDLLSVNCWSPEDDISEDDPKTRREFLGQDSPVNHDGPETAAGAFQPPTSPERNAQGVTVSRSNWSRPYLKNDAPEWTDMTCMLSMGRERVMLPDSRWLWVNDWTVDLNGALSEQTDADGWSYEVDFETFSKGKRHYERGDACRRRRWTRTRMVKPPRITDPLRQLKFVWETTKDENGCFSVTVRSHVRIKNATSAALTFFVYTPSWDGDKLVGTAKAGEDVNVPVFLASAVYLRIAKNATKNEPAALRDCFMTERFSIVPTGHTSSSHLRTRMDLEDVSGTVLHFLVELRSKSGILDIIVEPAFRLVNLLPCQLECRVGEVLRSASELKPKTETFTTRNKEFMGVTKTETLTIQSGKEDACLAVSPWRKPHLSLRVPGYKWSAWKRIVNRKTDPTWRPSEMEEESHFTLKGDNEYAEELKTLVRFERLGKAGDPLILILSVACGHCPTIRVYAQYWIADKTGFGCRFSEGFMDLLGTAPDPETSRRSYLLKEESIDPEIVADMSVSGHQWSIGSSGMSLYFSHRERLALAIETGIDRSAKKRSKKCKSKWISPLDISNVIPKTVFSVDELNGSRRFELAIHVTLCPGLFARTKMISLLPRYQIVNLLHRELAIAQDGNLTAETIIPSQSSIPFHWEKGTMPPKVRLGAPSTDERASGNYERCWTNGRFQIDRIGITSLRLPTSNTLAKIPMVVQAEVRLATKDQPSAVVVVVWSGNEKSNPLYTLRNRTSHTILCRQPLQDQDSEIAGPDGAVPTLDTCTMHQGNSSVFECGTEIGPTIRSFLGLDQIEEFVWILKPNDVTCFGFDDPEKLHILEWTYVISKKKQFDKRLKNAFLEVDAMGSTSALTLPGGPLVRCQIRAEHSTKVIEFVEADASDDDRSGIGHKPLDSVRQRGLHVQDMLESKSVQVEDDETVSFSLRIDLPVLSISVVDNIDPSAHGREILLAQFENMYLAFSQTREGYHEFEVRLMTFQADNHVRKSIHPVLIFCPRADEREPLLHMSAVRRLQPNSNTFVFRYAAIRLLEVEIYLDRRTAETIARFIQPLMILREEASEDSPDWVVKLTSKMERSFARTDRRTPRDLEKMIHMANSGRIYLEQLHLHPVRLRLTFTQEWIDLNSGSPDTVMVFQFIRGMASIANAPLVFTSFVVGHVFESPQALIRVIATHYSSQLTKQVFGILGSLAILGAPADFISNVGTGVRDFFYEPIQGAVHGPRQFIEGLEAGTQSLARGLFVGVVRGAANVTDAVNANLAGLTADDDFIDERKAHQRMLTDAMSRGATSRTFNDSLNLACASVARGLKSGALGIIEQPAIYASKHGPVGFLKGVGKAMVGAVVKPVVGLGDGAVLVMNHMSDATSKQRVFPKIPKRLRRALPSHSLNCVRLEPYDERAAKAQKIVTGGESVDDVYIGHINISSHLIIASEQCLWAIDRRSREPWCVSWEEISHFGVTDGGLRIVVFSQTGLKTFLFQIETSGLIGKFNRLLSMQLGKMANVSELNSSLLSADPESLSRQQIPGVRARQVSHIFGSYNNARTRPAGAVRDEVDLVEQCHDRVRRMDSASSTYLKSLDEEAWSLVSWWGHLFSGLSSRRCIVASIINGTGYPIQIKSTKLVEGGSPCYSLATKEYDSEQGVLHAGGVIIFFGWGVVPNLLQAGNVFMHIETNGFISDLADQKSSATYATAMPGYQVGFLEKSYDDSGWWAKYWLLVRAKK